MLPKDSPEWSSGPSSDKGYIENQESFTIEVPRRSPRRPVKDYSDMVNSYTEHIRTLSTGSSGSVMLDGVSSDESVFSRNSPAPDSSTEDLELNLDYLDMEMLFEEMDSRSNLIYSVDERVKIVAVHNSETVN